MKRTFKKIQNIVLSYRTLSFSLASLLLFSLGSYAVASFAPGATINPSCSPSDPTCYVELLPSQTGNSGKYLTTDGTSASWGTLGNIISSLNGLTDATQTFTTGTSGSDFNISSSSGVHTFNIPDAGASARGFVTTGTQTLAGAKTFTSRVTSELTTEQLRLGYDADNYFSTTVDSTGNATLNLTASSGTPKFTFSDDVTFVSSANSNITTNYSGETSGNYRWQKIESLGTSGGYGGGFAWYVGHNGGSSRIGMAIGTISTTANPTLVIGSSAVQNLASFGAPTGGATGIATYLSNTSGDRYSFVGAMNNALSPGGSETNWIQINTLNGVTATGAKIGAQWVPTSGGYSSDFVVNVTNESNTSGEKIRIKGTSGNVGIGTVGSTTVSAKLHVLSTTEQLRLGYDTSNYFSTTVSSAGNVTFNTTASSGTPYFLFSDPVGVGGSASPLTSLPDLWGSGGSAIEVTKAGTNESAGLFLRRANFTGIGLDIWTRSSTGYSYIDNRYDSASEGIYFRLRTAGTPITVMSLTSGNVQLGNWLTAATLDAVRIDGDLGFRSGGGNRKITGPTEASLILDVLADSSGEGLDVKINGTSKFIVDYQGRAGIGTTTPASLTHILGTTEQLRLGYDANNYFSTTVGSTGGVTYDAVGSGSRFTFNDSVYVAGPNVTNRVNSDVFEVVRNSNSNYIYRFSSNGDYSARMDFYNGSNSVVTQISGNGSSYFGGAVGFGTNTSPAVPIHVINSSQQVRIGYDASNYYSTTVSSGGDTTFDTTGGDFIFNDNTQFKNASNGDYINIISSGGEPYLELFNSGVVDGRIYMKDNGRIGFHDTSTSTYVPIEASAAYFYSSIGVSIGQLADGVNGVINLYAGNNSGEQAYIRMANSGVEKWSFGVKQGDNALQFVYGGASLSAGTLRAALTSAGDLSLGTGDTSPSARLHLVKTTEQLRIGYDANNYYTTTVASNGYVTFDTNASSGTPRFNFSDPLYANSTFFVGGATQVVDDSGGGSAYIQRSGGLYKAALNNPSGAAGSYVSSTPTTVDIYSGTAINMRLTGTGANNIVFDTLTTAISGATGTEIGFSNVVNHQSTYGVIRGLDSSFGGTSAVQTHLMLYGGQNTTDSTYGNIILQHNGTSNRGFVGIGDFTPSYKLEVYNDVASSYTANFVNDGNNANRYGIQVQAGLDDHTAAGPSTLINFTDGDGTTVGSITFASSNTLYNSTSDRRLKENIVNTSLSIDLLNRIQIRDYTWIADQSHKIAHGVIAQELYEVYPDAVTKPQDEENGIWMVDYSKLVPVAVQAIKDLNVKISALDPNTNTSFAQKLIAFFGDAGNGIGDLFANRIQTKELCLEDVCVTKTQLQQLLSQQSSSQNTSVNPEAGSASNGDTTVTETTTEENTDENTETTVIEEANTEEEIVVEETTTETENTTQNETNTDTTDGETVVQGN